MERHAGGGEGATGRGQGWLTDACRGRWGKVDRKEGGNGKRRGAAEGDGEGGQEGGGQWGGGISVMECLGGHTFPEQRRVTQLVFFINTS